MKDEAYFKETKLSGEVIFDGKVLHLRKDEVRLPDGNTSTREYCIHNGAVAIVPLTDDGKVILVRQYRYAVGKITIEIPAGKLNFKEEDRLSAAIRELREETGLSAAKITNIGDFETSPTLLTEIITLYLAEGLSEGETDFDDDEFIEIIKMPLEDAVNLIIEGKIKDSKTQAAILKVWAIKQRNNK